MTVERALEVTKHTIEEAEFCFLITLAGDGTANARLMQPFGPEPDLTIWFGVSPESRKIEEIKRDSRVTVGYDYAEEGAYVTLKGQAYLSTDLEERRRFWREDFSDFWPEGPESDNYILIKFVPSRIEVMNMVKEVAPDPFGLEPVALVHEEAGWRLE